MVAIKEEFFELESGQGLLEVRGNDFESGLRFEGNPVAFMWCDCQGSLAQYLVRSRNKEGISNYIKQLRYVTEGRLNLEIPLYAQVFPLLQLFNNGHYKVIYRHLDVAHEIIDYSNNFLFIKDCQHFYPYGDVIITTQSNDLLSQERVNYFVNQIKSGIKPVLLLASVRNGWGYFLLDGHHKLMAYRELSIPPMLLIIEKQEESSLTLAEGESFFDTACKYKESYTNLKPR